MERSKRLFILCNAIDDRTRLERGIDTDSPAASRKVFLMAKAMRSCGGRVWIISSGRGRQDWTGRLFARVLRRTHQVPVIYLPFLNLPILSEIVSLIAPVYLLIRLHRLRHSSVVLFYNRQSAYLPALITAGFLRFGTALDLEDGALGQSHWSIQRCWSKAVCFLFDRLCRRGALLACEALSTQTTIRPAICYYGCVEASQPQADWGAGKISVLMGGTVSSDTGANQLIEAIRILRLEKPTWVENLQFEITGKGDCLVDLSSLGRERADPVVRVHGRTTDVEYSEILRRSHVGLALKPTFGELANTTFPSKVIELANVGLLVVTTDISDVKKVLAEKALYISGEGPYELISQIHWIVHNRDAARTIAQEGARLVNRMFNSRDTGQRLLTFLLPNLPC